MINSKLDIQIWRFSAPAAASNLGITLKLKRLAIRHLAFF